MVDQINYRYYHVRLFLVGFVLLLLVAACNDEPPPPMVTAECNPTAVLSSPLPKIVQSITHLGPELYGPVHSLHVVGNKVYMGLGDAFAVMDASNAAEPRLVGRLPLTGQRNHMPISAFSIHDNLAYFAWGGKNFTVDVSNPAEPIEVNCTSAVPWPGAANAFRERYYISNSTLGGIRIEERPLGAAPLAVASYATYTAPELEWRQPPGQFLPLPALVGSEPMYVRRYTFDERYLYLLNVIRIPGDYCCGSLTILDLENPAEPRHLSTTQLPVEYAPFYLKAAEEMLFITFYEPRGYNPTTIMYDITRKGSPVEITSIPGFALPYVHNGYAYFPGDGKFDIWQLRGEDGPELVGRIEFPGLTTQGENRLAFVGEYIYYSAVTTLIILNNQDPANPYLVDQTTYPLLSHSQRLTILDGRLASVMNGPYQDEIQLWEPDEAGQMGEWEPLPGAVVSRDFEDIAVAEDWIYGLEVEVLVGSRTTYLHGYSLSGTADVPTATLSIPNFASHKMAANFPYLYLLESTLESSTLKVMNVSDPANPEPVWEMALEPAVYKDLVVWEDSLYLVSTMGRDNLWRFDLSDRERPQLVESHSFEPLHAVTVGGGFLFGLNVAGEVVVIDLRPPTGPALVGRYDLGQELVEDIAYEDGVLYLALGERGAAAVQLNLDE